MIIESTRLGKLETEPAEFVAFPNGLPGFKDEQKFVFLPCSPDSPFFFMQSVTDPDLTFLLVEPFAMFSDYEFSLDKSVMADLALSDEQPPQIFNIVTATERPEEMTANLLAPVIVNPIRRIAQQIVLEKVPYTTRHRLFPDGLPRTDAEGGK